MNENIENLIVNEKLKAEKADVIFDLNNNDKVYYKSIKCNGFFESKYQIENEFKPYLAVAVKKPLEQWLPIFVHESCHMDQWLEKSSLWLDADDFKLLDSWLSGTLYPREVITNFIYKVIQLDADCERRTIDKIKKYDLPIDVSWYATRANAYLYYYQWLLVSRKWYKTAPYEIEEILNLMPKVIKEDSEYLKSLSTEMLVLFNQCRNER